MPEDREQTAAPEGWPGTRCGCGHPMNDFYRCLNNRVYGPCESEFCGGVCEDTWGTCKNDENCTCAEVYGE